jgi:putative transposase
VWRLEILEGRADPATNPLAGRKMRARKYWQARYREAEALYGNGFVGLLPHRRDNTQPRASRATLELAQQTITSDWESIRNRSRRVSWGRYRLAAREQGLTAISYTRFCELVRARHGHQQQVRRVGEKAAYDLEPQYLQMEFTTPRHGIRPWHIAHIDHTPLPLKFVHQKLGDIAPPIWLTILMDAFSRKILAHYLTFDPPSYRSCMMVVRDCVRRHHRVPQIINCDGGAEFNSVYWETLLAQLNVSKRERRLGKPRYGSTCERVFNTTQEQFISNLMGSTEVAENYFRRISPEVSPSYHAVWTLDQFDDGFEKYLSEVYHVNHHTGIGGSPHELWAMGVRSHGERTHRLYPYDKQFIIQTCPAVNRGRAKVTPAGIKVNYRWFKCDAFSRPGVLDTKVPARYDPNNPGMAYAFVHGKWQECYSEHYAVFSQYSERSIWLATERIKLVNRTQGQRVAINAERIAHFLRSLEADETLAKQLRNDAESQRHRCKIAAPARPSPQQPPPPPPTPKNRKPQSRSVIRFQVLEDL